MTIQKDTSQEFYRSLQGKAGSPIKVMFELTHRCNFHCIHCYVVPKRKRELETAEVKAILDELKRAGTFHVGFTGGEPLIRPDIFEILDYAKENGFRISLLTNGFRINARTAKRIAALGTSLNRVDVSVLGFTPHTFERIVKRENSHRKVMTAIRLLKQAGVNVQIKATLLKPNQDEFLKIKRLAARLGVMFRYCASVSPKTNGDAGPLMHLADPRVAFHIEHELSNNKKTLNEHTPGRHGFGPTRPKPLFRCAAGRTEMTISPYGEIKVCPQINGPAYNILTLGFDRCWKKMRRFVDKLHLPKGHPCSHCDVALFCRHCPARGLLAGSSNSGCSLSEKTMAEIRAKN